MDVPVSYLLKETKIEKASLETDKGDVLHSITPKQETKGAEPPKKDGEKKMESYVLSNFCSKIAFDMMANGSGGVIREGLLLHSRGKPIDRVNEIYPLTIEFFTETGNAGGPRITVSRAIWVHSPTKLKADFQEVMEKYYGAKIYYFDDHDKGSMKTKVNGWLEEEARRLLVDPFGTRVVGADTRLILATAVTLEGEWFQPFEDAGVREFTLLDGKNVQVPFMSSHGRHYVQQFKNFKILSVPFKQHKASEFSMLFYLSDRLEDTEDLRTCLGQFEEVIQKVYFPEQQVQVGKLLIPKITIKMRGPLPFKGGWDFDQMADSTGLVSHGGQVGSFLEINEKGVRAAGSNAFFFDKKRSAKSFSPRDVITRMEKIVDIDFVANRPFFFFIRDNKFGRMMFSGGFVNPVGESASFEPITPANSTHPAEVGPEWLDTIDCQSSEEAPDLEWLETIACHPSSEGGPDGGGHSEENRPDELPEKPSDELGPEWLDTLDTCRSKEE